MQMNQHNSSPKIIGLTGGIGSGKSTASQFFAEQGVEIIDADDIAKALVQAGSTALKEIETHFGQHVLLSNGQLNRPLLREVIFNNNDEKQWLENLLHPLIRERIKNLISHSSAPYIILSAPLLLESKQYDFVDRVLVIDLSPELQIARSTQRDQSTIQEIEKIMATQLSRGDRLTQANDIIINDQDVDSLKQQVLTLHQTYLRL